MYAEPRAEATAQGGQPERRIERVLKSSVLGRRRVTLGVIRLRTLKPNPILQRMAWPKKNTRPLIVDGTRFLWHHSGGALYTTDGIITVGIEGDRYFLHIDPFPHDFEIRPATVADCIRWALARGWSTCDGPTRGMAFDAKTGFNVWLPDGVRYLSDVASPAVDERPMLDPDGG